MATIGNRLQEEWELIKGLRDELKVQLHLGGAEARDQWDKLENEWHHLEGKMKQLGGEGREIAEEVGDAADLLVDQLRVGYERFKKLL